MSPQVAQEALAKRARGVARAYGKIMSVPVTDDQGRASCVEVHATDCCCLPCTYHRRTT
jgi:hypothetical protein